MFQFAYVSKPIVFDTPTLLNILLTSRVNNARLGITGVLYYRHDVFFQLLEGETETVKEKAAEIERDIRHEDFRVVGMRRIQSRLFPGWSMKDGGESHKLWTPRDVRAGVMRNLSPDEAFAFFTRSADRPLSLV